MRVRQDELDLALRELREEELPYGAEEALRARVMQAVERPQRVWWRWAWAPALAAACALVWFLMPVRVEPRREVAAVPERVEEPVQAAPAPIQPVPAPRRPQPTQPPVQLLPAVVERRAGTEFLQIATDDPQVVILWAVEKEGAGL